MIAACNMSFVVEGADEATITAALVRLRAGVVKWASATELGLHGGAVVTYQPQVVLQRREEAPS